MSTIGTGNPQEEPQSAYMTVDQMLALATDPKGTTARLKELKERLAVAEKAEKAAAAKIAEAEEVAKETAKAAAALENRAENLAARENALVETRSEIANDQRDHKAAVEVFERRRQQKTVELDDRERDIDAREKAIAAREAASAEIEERGRLAVEKMQAVHSTLGKLLDEAIP